MTILSGSFSLRVLQSECAALRAIRAAIPAPRPAMAAAVAAAAAMAAVAAAVARLRPAAIPAAVADPVDPAARTELSSEGNLGTA